MIIAHSLEFDSAESLRFPFLKLRDSGVAKTPTLLSLVV